MRPLFLLFLLSVFTTVKAQTSTNGDIPINLPPASPSAAPAAAATAPSTTASAITPAQLQALQNAHALREASELIRDGKADDALIKLNALLQSDPRNISAYVLRGQIYSGKKMLDKAANDFQAASLIDPKNILVKFDMAEIKFMQKDYVGARTGFVEIQNDKTSDLGDLAGYKVFLCDLFGGNNDAAQKEFDAFNSVGSYASYYYANAAWSLFHHNPDDARSWLASAGNIYNQQKNRIYSKSLFDLGYLPLPPPAAH
jgi:tetratricopeptide (TPR) repeat protein